MCSNIRPVSVTLRMKKGPEMKEYTLIIKGEMDFIILSPQVLSSLILKSITARSEKCGKY